MSNMPSVTADQETVEWNHIAYRLDPVDPNGIAVGIPGRHGWCLTEDGLPAAHPFEPKPGSGGRVCKVCDPWGPGAHVHYPTVFAVRPTLTANQVADAVMSLGLYGESPPDDEFISALTQSLNRVLGGG